MPRVCFKPSKAPLGKSPDSCPQQEAFCDVESAYLSRSIFCPFGTFPTCYHGPLLPPSATHPTNCSVSLLSESRSDMENPWLGSCPARSLGLSSLAHLFLRTQSWADPHKNIKGAAVVSNSVQPPRRQPTRLLCPWDFPGKSTRVGWYPYKYPKLKGRGLCDCKKQNKTKQTQGPRACSSSVRSQGWKRKIDQRPRDL